MHPPCLDSVFSVSSFKYIQARFQTFYFTLFFKDVANWFFWGIILQAVALLLLFEYCLREPRQPRNNLMRHFRLSVNFLFCSVCCVCVLAQLLIDLRCGCACTVDPRTRCWKSVPLYVAAATAQSFGFCAQCKMTVFAWRNHVGLGANGFIISVSGNI